MYKKEFRNAGIKKAVLQIDKNVSNSVQRLTRVNLLTFKHHQLIAPDDLPIPEVDEEKLVNATKQELQKYWLGSALENKWSVKVLIYFDVRQSVQN